MKALLLAAGLGTRLRPLTERVPKCLVPIRGRPLLDYWLELLLPHGVERILINCSYLAEQVHAHVAASPWRAHIDLIDETSLLGTGGTIRANRAYFSDQPFLVAHADNLSRFPLAAFIDRHRNRPAGCDMTMMTFDCEDPSSCGIVEQDRSGVVRGFHEKVANPPGRCANGAVYIFEPAVADFICGLGQDMIDLSTEILPTYVGRIATWHNDDYHRDIGTPDSLSKAERDY